MIVVSLIAVVVLLALVAKTQQDFRTVSRANYHLREQHRAVDEVLDLLLRFYSLHVSDPYVTRPGFDERRCFHCHYPDTHGHSPDCIWLRIRPLTQTLYETNTKR